MKEIRAEVLPHRDGALLVLQCEGVEWAGVFPRLGDPKFSEFLASASAAFKRNEDALEKERLKAERKAMKKAAKRLRKMMGCDA